VRNGTKFGDDGDCGEIETSGALTDSNSSGCGIEPRIGSEEKSCSMKVNQVTRSTWPNVDVHHGSWAIGGLYSTRAPPRASNKCVATCLHVHKHVVTCLHTQVRLATIDPTRKKSVANLASGLKGLKGGKLVEWSNVQRNQRACNQRRRIEAIHVSLGRLLVDEVAQRHCMGN
jgi:hypothetical protein